MPGRRQAQSAGLSALQTTTWRARWELA